MYGVSFAELTIGMRADVAKAKILEMGKAFMSTPIGWITAAVGAVLALGAVTTAFTDRWQKQVKTAQEALKVNEENVQQYQSELDSLEQLQKKLEEAQGDKKALAAIQGELNDAIGETVGLLNGEAEAYKIATVNLQAQINAKKKLIAQEQQDAVNNNKAIFDEKGIQNSFLGIDWLSTDTGNKELKDAAKIYQEAYRQAIEEGLSSDEASDRAYKGTAALFGFKFDKSDWDKYWQEQVSTAYSVFESTIDNYDGFGGSTFIQKVIESGVRGGKSLDQIQQMLNEISSNDIQPLVNEYIASLDNPDVDSESLYNNIIKKLDEIKKKYPELATLIDGYSKDLVNDIDNVSSSLEDAESSFKSIAKTLSDGLDKLSNKKDILSEVKEELDSFGAISADNISKILEQFADDDGVQQAVAYYLSGIGTAQQVYDAMAKGYQNDLKLQAQTLATKMQNDEKYYKAIGGLSDKFINFMRGKYQVELKDCKTLAEAKDAINNQLLKNLQKNWSKYSSWLNQISMSNIDARITELEVIIRRIPNSYTSLISDYTTILNQLKAIKNGTDETYSKLDELIFDDFDTSGFNTSLSTTFDKDSGKTEAEKYFDKLKYKLETNQITQEQYLKELDWGYKHFYNKTADYLEDYAKYSQEVYDGFKDMYKEDLEADKEALEEKKKAVSEYYDNLREQIEDAHDEEDYEKEQSEKRKEIFDLDMQIAELMRDGSEKAKARIAELEEERLKAEEELLDFETDKAREDELSRLEKEQEAEEAKIQKQIDGIQGQLDQLDKDTISVRNAIIAYAKEKGVTLNFAYASGTRSSVGGFGRINEKGIEMISAPDGNGNYIPMLPNSYVFSAKATEFLWKLATEHSLPQAMYNSIAKSIKTQSRTPSVNIAQPITITMGDVIIKGNADKQTVADIKKQQENTVRMVLQKIKELQK